jgi:predicted restriction endonuclease
VERGAGCRGLSTDATAEQPARFGALILFLPRLGQGSIRVVVTDAYEHRYAVTKERTLSVLKARTHQAPRRGGGENRIDNGLLLRRDLHSWFDRGYITVSPKLRFDVSRRIKEVFGDGRDYHALQRRELCLPIVVEGPLKEECLRWHTETTYLA